MKAEIHKLDAYIRGQWRDIGWAVVDNLGSGVFSSEVHARGN